MINIKSIITLVIVFVIGCVLTTVRAQVCTVTVQFNTTNIDALVFPTLQQGIQYCLQNQSDSQIALTMTPGVYSGSENNNIQGLLGVYANITGQQGTIIDLTGSTTSFISIQESDRSAVVSTNITLTNIQFQNSDLLSPQLDGAIVSAVTTQSLVSISVYGCQFNNISAAVGGIFYLNTGTYTTAPRGNLILYVQDSTFTNIKAINGGIIRSQAPYYIRMLNNTMSQITAIDVGSIANVDVSSTLRMDFTDISNSQFGQYGLVAMENDCQLYIYNSTFDSITYTQPNAGYFPAIASLQSSFAFLINNTFTNNQAGGIYLIGDTDIVTLLSSFSKTIYSNNNNTAIFADTGSSISASVNRYTNNTGAPLIVANSSEILFYYNNFTGNQYDNGSIISVTSASQITFSNTSITTNETLSGSVFYCQQQKDLIYFNGANYINGDLYDCEKDVRLQCTIVSSCNTGGGSSHHNSQEDNSSTDNKNNKKEVFIILGVIFAGVVLASIIAFYINKKRVEYLRKKHLQHHEKSPLL